jgi:fucose permease
MTLLGLAVLGFLSLGLPDGVLGVAWPSMRRSFELPVSQLGVLLGSAMVGYLASSFASGALVARLGVGRLLAASGAATASSALLYALAPAWEVVLLGGLVGGLGAGAIDAGINAFAAARFSPRLTTWLHASYGVGATLGPLLTTAVLAAGRSWRWAYGAIAVLLAALTASFACTTDRWTMDPAPGGPGPGGPSIAAALQRGAVWLNVGLFFLYTGLEVAAGQWAYSWLVEGRGVTPGIAGGWVAVYWGSLTAGRVVLGALTARVPPESILRGSLLGVPVGVVWLWAGLGPSAGATGLAILGLALAPTFPLLIAATPERVGAPYAAHAVGFQIAAAYLGAATLPGTAGVLARRLGLEVLGPFLLGVAGALGGLYGIDAAWRARGGTMRRTRPGAAPGGVSGWRSP